MKSKWNCWACVVVAVVSSGAIAQPCDSWTAVAASGDVPTGYTFGWTYDSVRDRAIAIGGAVGNRNPLREFDGTQWVLRTSAHSPPPLADMPMTFDSSRGRCVAIGGLLNNSNSFVDGHWEWDGTDWVELNIPRPSARSFGALAYDSSRAKVVAFGGVGNSGLLGDLWEFDGSAWTQINATGGPSPRYAMAAAYDEENARVVMFGGRNSSAIPGGTWYNETWTWDGTSWAQLPGVDDPQLPLNYHMVPDPVTGRLIMIAYFSGSMRCYAFEANGWTLLNIGLPPFRQWFGYVADTARDRILLYGGIGNSSMWEFKAQPRPVFSAQPVAQSMRLGTTLALSASLSGEPNPQLRWFRNGAPLANGGRVSGATTATLSIVNTEPADSGSYYLRAIGATCTTQSTVAEVHVWCLADLTGGQVEGSPDGAVDVGDLLYFLFQFEQGAAVADLDDGSTAGVPDGGVDVSDLLFFLARFEGGC